MTIGLTMRLGLVGTAIVLAAGAAPGAQVADLSWLAGHWLECSAHGEVAETWTDDRGGVMLGFSKSIRNGRTSWESSRIDRTPGGLMLFARPKGQSPAVFRSVSITKSKAVFENPDHDFPQRVIYVHEGDRLTGRIEGIVNGKLRAVEWHYRSSPLNGVCSIVSLRGN